MARVSASSCLLTRLVCHPDEFHVLLRMGSYRVGRHSLPFITFVSSIQVQVLGTTLAGCSSTWALGSLRPPSRNAMWTSLVLRVLGEPSESLLDAGSLPALRLQPGIRPCSPFVPARRAVLLRDHPDLASSTVRLRAPSANWIP